MTTPSPPVDYGRAVMMAVISAIVSAVIGGGTAFLAATTASRIEAATFRVQVEKDVASLQDWRHSTERDRYRKTDARADLRALCAWIDAVRLRLESASLDNRSRIIELERQIYDFHLNGISAPPVNMPPACN